MKFAHTHKQFNSIDHKNKPSVSVPEKDVHTSLGKILSDDDLNRNFENKLTSSFELKVWKVITLLHLVSDSTFSADIFEKLVANSVKGSSFTSSSLVSLRGIAQ